MKRKYSAEELAKTRITNNALWILLIFILFFVMIMFRIATHSGSLENLFNTMPSGDDAYKVAVNYIKPTLGSRDVKFTDGEYQCTKRSDSVYVIKSYFETTYSINRAVKTNYIITLRYIGGEHADEQSWSVINLEEH